MRKRANGFGRMDALVVITVVVIAIALLVPFTPFGRSGIREAPQGEEQRKLRYIHQAMVNFAANNNTYLPGLDAHGKILPIGATELASASGPSTVSGASMSARYFQLIRGGYLEGDHLIHQFERETVKTAATAAAPPMTAQFSYALLRIGESATGTGMGNHIGRKTEWVDNANSQAIMMSDKNIGTTTAPGYLKSLWTDSWRTGKGWVGMVVWGDNHVEWIDSADARLGRLGLSTKYAGVVNSDDFLFGSADGPGKVGSASAMFGYLSEDF